MNHTLPVLAALALGLAVPASAQEAPLPPPEGADAPAVGAPDAAPPAAGERGHRPGPGGRRGPGGPGGAPGFGMPEGGRLGFLVPLLQQPETAAKIGLPEDKAAALAATFADLDAQMKVVNEKLPAAFKAQAEALGADTVDEAAALAAVNAVWDLRREVALLQTRKVLAIRSTLDAEQLKKAEKLLRQAWRDFGERRPGGDRGPGGRKDVGGRRPGGDRGPGDRQGFGERRPDGGDRRGGRPGRRPGPRPGPEAPEAPDAPEADPQP